MGVIHPSRMLMQARQAMSRWPEIDALVALPALTLLVLLLNMPGPWYLSVPLVIASAIGLVYPSTMRTPAYWFVMATLVGTTVYLHWDIADNHQYLFVYWCLALCAAFSLPRTLQAESLQISSRWLLGLCMLLATCWKLATRNYVDGTFFEFTLLTDPRFAEFAAAISGIDLQQLADNRALVDLLQNGYQQGMTVNSVTLSSVAGVTALAAVLTWWTVFIEGALAALFLLPDRRGLSRWRNTALLLFATTTYSVAHVRGFGWMLMLLGISQCGPDEKHWRTAYFAAFLLIQLFFVPTLGW